jgi:hypothetical protein
MRPADFPLRPARMGMLPVSRRKVLQGVMPLAATAGLPRSGCLAPGPISTLPSSGNPQPMPNEPKTQASLPETITTDGSIAKAFAGLSYEKGSLHEKPLSFAVSMSNLNLGIAAQLPQSAATAALLEMTQLSSGATGPSLSATSGMTIHGASVGVNRSLTPAAANTLSANGLQVSCYLPALSAVLVQITQFALRAVATQAL